MTRKNAIRSNGSGDRGRSLASVDGGVAGKGVNASTDDIKVPYAVNIGFGDEQVTPDAMHVRAFVPTGSMSTNCLATLSESNEAAPGITVFCAPREDQGQKGILFSAFFPQPITSGLILSATIHQDYASGYGAPVFYPGI